MFHTQNLNETRNGDPKGSMFWHGRAWLRSRHSLKPYGREFRCEWMFGKHARDFALTASFGYGDDDRSVCLHLCLPWLFSVYLVLSGVLACKECKTGVAIHNGGFWIYLMPYAMESNHNDPWWRKNLHWEFPWNFDWWRTEILDARHGRIPLYPKRQSDECPVVWCEDKWSRKPFLETYEARKQIEAEVTEIHPYAYTLKSGEVQQRTAAIHCSRMEWRARWWPLIWRKKVCTSIDIAFSEEVGEGTGSWKGGCTGCGYDMLPGETMLQTLTRMERERTFKR